MATLHHHPNIPDPDGFYAELIASQSGLDDAQAQALLARLVLVLSNHVGDRQVLREALALARATALATAAPAAQPLEST